MKVKNLLTILFIPFVLTAAFIAGQFSRLLEINALESQARDDQETIQELLAYSYACGRAAGNIKRPQSKRLKPTTP